MNIDKSTLKGQRLYRNPTFPVELCSRLIDRYEAAASTEPLKTKLAAVTKRLFIHDLVIVEGGEKYRAKLYRTIGPKRRLEALFIRAESIRNLRAGMWVHDHGIPTAEPVCVWGSWKGGLHDWSVQFMRDIGEHTMLPDFMDMLDMNDHAGKKKVTEPLAKAIAKLHDAGVFVYDPAKNILVKRIDGELEFIFVDFDTVRLFMKPTFGQAVRTLRHCIRPPSNWLMFDDAERREFAKTYLEARGIMKWLDKMALLI